MGIVVIKKWTINVKPRSNWLNVADIERFRLIIACKARLPAVKSSKVLQQFSARKHTNTVAAPL